METLAAQPRNAWGGGGGGGVVKEEMGVLGIN